MPANIFKLGVNLTAWAWQFFSIGFLLPRLFSPWHKDISNYGRGFVFSKFIEVFAWNLISRFIGAIIRILVIVAGLAMEVVVVAGTAMVFVCWYGLPLIILYLLFSGLAGLKIT